MKAMPPARLPGQPLKSARLTAAWTALVVLAIPFAWAIAALGFTLPLAAPGRDIALLILWSASEEIVFRGGLQMLLARVLQSSAARRHWLGISMPNLLTSLAFCAVHAWNKPALVVLGLLPVSLLLGASLERSGRLWVPIALHAYFNLLLYAASAWVSA
jgi:membrane protease YdiL (CAAX protease family)